MRLTNALHCAMIVGLLSPALVRADDVGVDIAATAYDFESKPDNSFIIADMGTKVGYVRNDSGTTEYWGYERFDFGEGATHLTVRASSATGGGTLHVRLASHYNPFTTVATVEIPNTGGWDSFQDFTVPVDPEVIAWLNGRTLFFVVEDDGNEDYKFDIESFRFDDVPSQPTNAAQYSAESYPSDDDIIRDMGNKVGYIQNGGWVRYSQFDLGAEPTTFSVRASSATAGGILYVTTQAPYGFGAANLIAVVDIGATEGWDDFREFQAELLAPAGGVTNNLYLNFEGGDGYLYDIESFELR